MGSISSTVILEPYVYKISVTLLDQMMAMWKIQPENFGEGHTYVEVLSCKLSNCPVWTALIE